MIEESDDADEPAPITERDPAPWFRKHRFLKVLRRRDPEPIGFEQEQPPKRAPLRLVEPPPAVVVVQHVDEDPLLCSLTDNQWIELGRLVSAPQPPSGSLKRHVQAILVEKGLAWPAALTGCCVVTDAGRRRWARGRRP